MHAQASWLPWASRPLRAAFTSLGTRRLLLSAAAALLSLVVSYSLIAAAAVPGGEARLAHDAAHVPHSCASAAGNDSAAYYRCFVPPRIGPRWAPQPGVRSEGEATYYVADWAQCPLAAGEPGFKRLCNVAAPCEAPPTVIHTYDDLPQATAAGERIQSAIQRGLRAAWGKDPPQIDLYFRAGCGAVDEIAQLLPSVELFWPEFIGEVIIALDAGNNQTLEYFLPRDWRTTRHSYRLVYEDVPCLPGRIFNQVSYLNLDAHSRAQFVVTIDSDCAFHSPVTPDVLFNDGGRLLLPISRIFQLGYWDAAVEFFTGDGTFSSHTMVSQPVAFALDTFAAYRSWIRERHGACYFDMVARFQAGATTSVFASVLRWFGRKSTSWPFAGCANSGLFCN